MSMPVPSIGSLWPPLWLPWLLLLWFECLKICIKRFHYFALDSNGCSVPLLHALLPRLFEHSPLSAATNGWHPKATTQIGRCTEFNGIGDSVQSTTAEWLHPFADGLISGKAATMVNAGEWTTWESAQFPYDFWRWFALLNHFGWNWIKIIFKIFPLIIQNCIPFGILWKAPWNKSSENTCACQSEVRRDACIF